MLKLYAEDPNWGLLSKNPGQFQCTATECGNISCGYAGDAIIYRATNQVVDVIAGMGLPGASVVWQLVPKIDSNNWVPPPCEGAAAPSDALEPEETLTPGQARTSADGRFKLQYNGDGNLVLYENGAGPLWASQTASSPGQVVMQSDGNLLIYDGNSAPVWATGTSGNPGAHLKVQSDGNVILYGPGGVPLWATNTCCH